MVMGVISLLVMIALVAADQLIKLLVSNVLPGAGVVSVIPGLLDFRYVQNYGAAFGMMQGKTWFFLIATGVVCAALIAGLFLYKKHNWMSYTASILIVAGGVGNLIDRIFNEGHFVTDYIHVSFFPPVFNFADILVTLGTISMVVYVIFFSSSGRKKSAKSTPNVAQQPAEIPEEKQEDKE